MANNARDRDRPNLTLQVKERERNIYIYIINLIVGVEKRVDRVLARPCCSGPADALVFSSRSRIWDLFRGVYTGGGGWGGVEQRLSQPPLLGV